MKTFVKARPILCFSVLLLGLAASGKATAKDDYVAHEWGTFTSLQAPDGTLLHWNAGAPTDLPKFVYNWNNTGEERHPAGALAFNKSRAALQRMETPVVYLYGDPGQVVDVKVQFPKGTITEWYPHAMDIGPSSRPFVGENGNPTNEVNLESMIRWNATILSKEEGSRNRLPRDKSDNHYFTARETDAALLQVKGPTSAPAESEKFLFYRGIGNFGTPLKVTGEGDTITLSNTGDLPLKHLFVYTVKNERGQVISVPQLASRETKAVAWSGASEPLEELIRKMESKMTASLRKQGLYAREAEAMVNTWKDSWLAEEGTRVLYTLPDKWTEETLPMTLTPKPRELVRVMVGRAELIPAALEGELMELITQGKMGKQDVSRQVATLLEPHGRFGHSIFVRALTKVDPNREQPELFGLYSPDIVPPPIK